MRTITLEEVGNQCPFCGTDILLSVLRNRGVSQKEKFFCDDCGSELEYTTVNAGIGINMHLHLMDEESLEVVYGNGKGV